MSLADRERRSPDWYLRAAMLRDLSRKIFREEQNVQSDILSFA